MKIYTFWSGDTTYITKSKSLKKAQEVGRDVWNHYRATCKYLEEAEAVGGEYFIPSEVEDLDWDWAKQLLRTDPDVMVLDNEILDMMEKEMLRNED